MFDVLVIGGGLIGSAAFRHLSGQSLHVGLLGPDEPSDWSRHEGAFASHYDAGRITRTLDQDAVWGCLAQRAMARYAALERLSGVRFHEPRGFLHLGPPPTSPTDKLARVAATGEQLGVPFERLDTAALQRRFPYLYIPPGYMGLYERGSAGCINPRALVRAQQAVAVAQQGTILRDTALSIAQRKGCLEVSTESGARHRCRKALIATGAFTKVFDLLPRPLDLDVKAETVWLSRIAASTARALHAMPSLWYDFDWHPSFPYAYLLPPLAYPDGSAYVKIGVDHDPDAEKTTHREITHFFQSGGHAQRGATLCALLQQVLPGLPLADGLMKPCILTYTPHGRPMIDKTEVPGVFVAVGGCGGAAKSSDELGRIAARLVQDSAWRYDLEASVFRASYT